MGREIDSWPIGCWRPLKKKWFLRLKRSDNGELLYQTIRRSTYQDIVAHRDRLLATGHYDWIEFADRNPY
jgi:hypothetical protein